MVQKNHSSDQNENLTGHGPVTKPARKKPREEKLEERPGVNDESGECPSTSVGEKLVTKVIADENECSEQEQTGISAVIDLGDVEFGSEVSEEQKEKIDVKREASTSHSPAYMNLKIQEENFIVKMSFTCNKEDDFLVTCHLCDKQITTTAKRGLIRIEDHSKTWNHIEKVNDSAKETSFRVIEDVEENHPCIFVLNGTTITCKECGSTISANARSRGDPVSRCSTHVNSASHIAKAKKNEASKMKSLNHYFNVKPGQSDTKDVRQKLSRICRYGALPFAKGACWVLSPGCNSIVLPPIFEQ